MMEMEVRTMEYSSDGNVGRGEVETEKCLDGGGTEEIMEEIIPSNVADGEFDALDLLPEEMWQAVFDHLEDPKDALNLYRTSQTLEVALKPKRILVFFPQVIHHLLYYLSRNDLLRLRLACKSWRKVIDSTFENHPVNLSFNETNRNHPCVQWTGEGLSFLHHTTLKFLEKMGDHPGNPFVGRNISLNRLRTEASWQTAKEFLRKFGREIWYLRFFFFNEPNPGGVFMRHVERHLRDCLMLVPNLKKLALWSSPDGYSVGADERMGIYFEKNPLPVLPHLRVFSAYEITDSMVNAVLKMCCVRENICSVFTQVSLPDIVEKLKEFPDITELNMKFKSISDFNGSRMGTWPLTSLSLGTWYTDTNDKFEFRSMFRLLERYGQTLKHVIIKIRLVDEEYNYNFPISLPHLKELEVDFEGPLDLLLSISSLERLHVSEYDSVLRSRSKLKVFGLEHNMYDSNIWECFPNLKKFAFSGKCGTVSGDRCNFREVYRRDVYQYYCDKNLKAVHLD